MAMLCLSSSSTRSSPETVWPVKSKLHAEHTYEGGKKVYINVQPPGHKTYDSEKNFGPGLVCPHLGQYTCILP